MEYRWKNKKTGKKQHNKGCSQSNFVVAQWNTGLIVENKKQINASETC